jgi:hypothetical protein
VLACSRNELIKWITGTCAGHSLRSVSFHEMKSFFHMRFGLIFWLLICIKGKLPRFLRDWLSDLCHRVIKEKMLRSYLGRLTTNAKSAIRVTSHLGYSFPDPIQQAPHPLSPISPYIC